MTGITSIELNVSGDIYEVTDLNNNVWKKKLAGLSDYTIKLSGNLDLTDAMQQSLQAAIITNPGTAVQWAILVTGVGGHSYSGSAFIKGFAPKFDTKAQAQASFDLEGNGAIVYA
jgi:predicted secreted protein